MHWVQEVTEPMKNQNKGRMVTGKRHVLVGRESSVKVVTMMAEYIIDTMTRLMPYDHKQHLSNAAHSWRQGCVDRLAERMRAKMQAMQTEDKAHDTADSVAAPGTAIVMKSVADMEFQKNYDTRYGAGAWARQQAFDAEWEANYQKRQAERAERHNLELARRQERENNETPSERTKRLAAEEKEARKQARANERYWNAQYAREEREAAKVDHHARAAGRKAAESISLNNQVGAGAPTKSLK